MKIFLAGGCLGNNVAIWRENTKSPDKAMDIFLAGISGDKNRANANGDFDGKFMNIYLAGCPNEKKRGTDYLIKQEKIKIFILESFYYVQDWMDIYIKNYWNFMLDSGAFTFMQDSKKKIDWDKYVEDYAKYINRLDIKLFFELDIDSVVGLKEVERLRAKLEKLTNKKCIPVWHKSRGKEYWLQLVKNYDYVAIGGIAIKTIKQNEYKYFTWFLNEAKKQNCKVHGLGFTNLKGLEKYKYDSVDSTSWVSGNKFGAVYWFDGKTMQKQVKKEGQRIKAKEVAIHNFKEWVKFQKYAEANL